MSSFSFQNVSWVQISTVYSAVITSDSLEFCKIFYGKKHVLCQLELDASADQPHFGDSIEVVVLSISDGGDVYVKNAPRKPRILLILDLNGVLGVREKFVSKKAPRNFSKRPHCDEFLRFCNDRFVIGLWSCSRRDNMETDILGDIHPLFIYDQDKSTSLYPRLSSVVVGKPLFLKEISRVWEEFSEFSAMNTVLVDNHLEKFERNPHGTCVIVPSFDGDASDCVLQLDGPFVLFLDKIHKSSHRDVRLPVLEMVETCPFVPIAHPEPPPQHLESKEAVVDSREKQERKSVPKKLQQQSKTAFVKSKKVQPQQPESQGMSAEPPHQALLEPKAESHNIRENQPESKSQANSHQRSPKYSLKHKPVSMLPSFTDQEVLNQYLNLVARYSPFVNTTVDDYLFRMVLPAPKAIPLRLKSVIDVCQRSFVVCEKTNGERRVMIAIPGDSTHLASVCVIDRSLRVVRLPRAAQDVVVDILCPTKSGATIIDGEWLDEGGLSVVDAANQAVPLVKAGFIVFDCFAVDGNFLGLSPGGVVSIECLSIVSRLDYLRSLIDKGDLSSSHHSLLVVDAGSDKFVLCVKQMIPVTKLNDILQYLPAAQDNCIDIDWPAKFHVSSNGFQLRYDIDGLVFSPCKSGTCYFSYTSLKWKPSDLMTIDFAWSYEPVDDDDSLLLSLCRRFISAMASNSPILLKGGFGSDGSRKKFPGARRFENDDNDDDNGNNANKKLLSEAERDGGFCDIKMSVQHAVTILSQYFPSIGQDAARNGCKQLVPVVEAIVRNRVMPRKPISVLILECSFRNRDSGDWQVQVVRTDKNRPNGFQVAWSTMEAIAEGLSLAKLLKLLENSENCPVVDDGNDCDVQPSNAVADHYDAIQRRRNEGSVQTDKIYFLRRANNWAKALMNQESVKRCGGGCLNVLDLGCGRGGDISKMRNVATYAGVDISPDSITEATRRAEHAKGIKAAFFFIHDISSPDLFTIVHEQTNLLFNVVTCQFVLNYIAKSREGMQNFANNVVSLMAPSRSVFVCVFADGDEVKRRLGDNSSWQNDCCQIVLDTEGPIDASFGRMYKFYLADAVQGCAESLLFFDELRSVFSEQGLLLDKSDMLDVYIREHWADKNCRTLWEKMARERTTSNDFPTMTDAEKETVSLYRIGFFTK